MKGRQFSEEHKAKLSKSRKGSIPWNKGLTKEDPRVKKYANREISEETRELLSTKLKGRKKSPEHIQKMSENAKRQWQNKKPNLGQ